MPSRQDRYSTNPPACAADEELLRRIAENEAAEAERLKKIEEEDPYLRDLMRAYDMNAVETDEEILAAIGDGMTDEDEAAVDMLAEQIAVAIDAPVNVGCQDVILVKPPSPPIVIPVNPAPTVVVNSVNVLSSASSDWSVRLPKIVKSLKNKRPVSVYRDTAFMRDLQGLLALRDAGTLDPSSVSRLSSLTHPLDRTIFDRFSKHPPWWLWLNGGEPLVKPARQFKTPPAWRDVSDTLRLHYFHLALKTLGPVHGFTLRLSHAVEAQARSKGDALGWLTARVARRLKDSLGRPVEVYIVAEEDEAGRLHLHGEFNIVGPEELRVDRVCVKVRKALRLAGGEWPKASKARQRQCEVKAASPDAGWSGYLAKDFAFFGPIVRPMLEFYGSSYAPGFKGDQVSRTKKLGEIAGKIYSEHRALVMDVRE